MNLTILRELRAIPIHPKLPDNSLILATFFSLGLHGALAFFLMPPLPKSSEHGVNMVEIIWDEGVNQPSGFKNQVSTFKDTQTSLKNNKKSACQPKQSSPLFKKIKFNPSTDKSTHTTARAPYHRENSEGALNQVEKKQRAPVLKTPQSSPRQSYRPLPKYPWVCRKRNQQGTVGIKVKTNAEGKVIQTILYKSSGHARLDQVSLEALQTWVFSEGHIEKMLSIVFQLKREHS